MTKKIAVLRPVCDSPSGPGPLWIELAVWAEVRREAEALLGRDGTGRLSFVQVRQLAEHLADDTAAERVAIRAWLVGAARHGGAIVEYRDRMDPERSKHWVGKSGTTYTAATPPPAAAKIPARVANDVVLWTPPPAFERAVGGNR